MAIRFFEVKGKNGQVVILSENEKEKLKDKIEEVRTEFTEKEIKELKLSERKGVFKKVEKILTD